MFVPSSLRFIRTSGSLSTAFPSTGGMVTSFKVFTAETKGFRVDIEKERRIMKSSLWKKLANKRHSASHRRLSLPNNVDWTNVWPSQRMFDHSMVPLPLRQGRRRSKKVIEKPTAVGNTELMKVPNFLHLTPKHIEKQCAAIKKFCVPWPKDLNNAAIDNYFPIETSQRTFLYSHSNVYDYRTRIATLKIKLRSLKLDYHATHKLIQLAGDDFDKATGYLTIVASRCPLYRQNLDLAYYQLIVMYLESWKIADWERETIAHEDVKRMDRARFNLSAVRRRLLRMINESIMRVGYFEGVREEQSLESMMQIPLVQELANSFDRLLGAKTDSERAIGAARAFSKYWNLFVEACENPITRNSLEELERERRSRQLEWEREN